MSPFLTIGILKNSLCLDTPNSLKALLLNLINSWHIIKFAKGTKIKSHSFENRLNAKTSLLQYNQKWAFTPSWVTLVQDSNPNHLLTIFAEGINWELTLQVTLMGNPLPPFTLHSPLPQSSHPLHFCSVPSLIFYTFRISQ